MEFLEDYWDTYVTSVTGDDEINDDEFVSAIDELKKYLQALKSVKFPDPSIVGQWDETDNIEPLLHTLRSVTTVHDLQTFEFKSSSDVEALEKYFALSQSDPGFFGKIFQHIHKPVLNLASARIAALGKLPLALRFGDDTGTSRAKIVLFHLESENLSLMLTPSFVFQYNGTVYACKDLKHAMILVYGKLFPAESVSVVVRDSSFALDSILNLQLPLPVSLNANERTHNIPTLFTSSPSIRIEQTCAGRPGIDISDDLYYACEFPECQDGHWLTPVPTPCLIPGFVMVRTSAPGTISYERLEGTKVIKMVTHDGFKRFWLSESTVNSDGLTDLEDRFHDVYGALASNNVWTQTSSSNCIFANVQRDALLSAAKKLSIPISNVDASEALLFDEFCQVSLDGLAYTDKTIFFDLIVKLESLRDCITTMRTAYEQLHSEWFSDDGMSLRLCAGDEFEHTACIWLKFDVTYDFPELDKPFDVPVQGEFSFFFDKKRYTAKHLAIALFYSGHISLHDHVRSSPGAKNLYWTNDLGEYCKECSSFKKAPLFPLRDSDIVGNVDMKHDLVGNRYFIGFPCWSACVQERRQNSYHPPCRHDRCKRDSASKCKD